MWILIFFLLIEILKLFLLLIPGFFRWTLHLSLIHVNAYNNFSCLISFLRNLILKGSVLSLRRIALEFADPHCDTFFIHINAVPTPFDTLSIPQGCKPENIA